MITPPEKINNQLMLIDFFLNAHLFAFAPHPEARILLFFTLSYFRARETKGMKRIIPFHTKYQKFLAKGILSDNKNRKNYHVLDVGGHR